MNGVAPLGNPRDDEESADASSSGLDLSPRSAQPRRGGPGTGSRKVVVLGVIAVLVAALGVVLFKGLNDASLFYYNVDEAVAKKTELVDQRFRMQGNVIDGTIEATDGGVRFVIAYGDAKVSVFNNGSPPELFSSEIPVVLEGEFVGDEFHSDDIIIRHDNNYDEKHNDRLKDAENDAKMRSRSPG